MAVTSLGMAWAARQGAGHGSQYIRAGHDARQSGRKSCAGQGCQLLGRRVSQSIAPGRRADWQGSWIYDLRHIAGAIQVPDVKCQTAACVLNGAIAVIAFAAVMRNGAVRAGYWQGYWHDDSSVMRIEWIRYPPASSASTACESPGMSENRSAHSSANGLAGAGLA